MKTVVLIVFVILFLVVIGVPYSYKRECFLVVNSPSEDIKVTVDSTVKKTFLGMPVIHAAPYKISIFCFDSGCLDDVESIVVNADTTDIKIEDITTLMTEGGLNTLTQPVVFNYEFNDSDVFTISLNFRDSTLKARDFDWSVRYEVSEGFSFLPLWVYFTH